MKADRGLEVEFLTGSSFVPDGGEWPPPLPYPFTLRIKKTGTLLTGGWVVRRRSRHFEEENISSAC